MSLACPTGRAWRASLGTLILLVATALTLRAPVTEVAPVLTNLLDELGLAPAYGGVLTTLPVVCLGVFAFVAPNLRRRLGDELVLTGSLVLILVGGLVRVAGSAWALFAGTVVLGAGIAIANVALPGLIKRDFATRVPAVTAVYTLCLTLGGAAGASIVVPLGVAVDSAWRLPFATIAGCSLLAMVVAGVRSVQVRGARTGGAEVSSAGGSGIWRQPLAWQVTVFMGLQSMSAYVVFGWLPSMALSRGFDAQAAGLLLGIQSLVQAAGSLTVPMLCRRLRDQRAIVVAVCVLSAVGYAGIMLGPAPVGVWVFAALLGLAQGATFGLALTLFGLRSPDSATATALSGMAQGCGYLIAAVGPLGIGLLHDFTGGWTVPLVFLMGALVVQLVAGWYAGRDVRVRSVHHG